MAQETLEAFWMYMPRYEQRSNHHEKIYPSAKTDRGLDLKCEQAGSPYFHREGADSPKRATVYCTNICIKYCHSLYLRDLRYKGRAVLPDTLLPGISETRQNDQGPFLCGVVVPEQPGPQEPHRGLPAPSILCGPPARPRLQPGLRRAEQGPVHWLAGRERRQEQGALGGPPRCRRKEAGGHPRGSRAWLTLSPSPLSPGAGERPYGAGQPPLEGVPAPSCPEEPGGRGGRRLRTAFSAEQLSTLESSFQRQQYLGAAERRKLAGKMRLSEVQIKTWFQNRRMKLKRQLQELRTEPFCSPPHPYGPQSGVVPLPLTYVAQPPPLPQQGAASGGFTLAAPTLDLSSVCRAQPVGFWAAPCFAGYRDPRAFLLGV
ncbi:LOW QUALITY PROTEIN: uncharacterized protein FYW35_012328 [Pterocles gutturalis]